MRQTLSRRSWDGCFLCSFMTASGGGSLDLSRNIISLTWSSSSCVISRSADSLALPASRLALILASFAAFSKFFSRFVSRSRVWNKYTFQLCGASGYVLWDGKVGSRSWGSLYTIKRALHHNAQRDHKQIMPESIRLWYRAYRACLLRTTYERRWPPVALVLEGSTIYSACKEAWTPCKPQDLRCYTNPEGISGPVSLLFIQSRYEAYWWWS